MRLCAIIDTLPVEQSDSASISAPPSESMPDRSPHFGTTLKLRLSLLITALLAIVTLAGGAYVVRKACEDIREETRSTLELTGHFLDIQIDALRDRWSTHGYTIP